MSNLNNSMLFRQVKNNIINILGEAEYGSFQTIGYQRQRKQASEVLGTKRFVQVYYGAGEFSKSAGRATSNTQHDCTFKIEFTVSAASKVDLTIINNPAATAAQLETAIERSLEASKNADDSFDELVNIIYQILMNPKNYDLGMPKGCISNRWINQIQKDDTVERGQLVVLVGSMLLTMRAAEEISGETPIASNGVQDTTIDISGDNTEQTGIKTS